MKRTSQRHQQVNLPERICRGNIVHFSRCVQVCPHQTKYSNVCSDPPAIEDFSVEPNSEDCSTFFGSWSSLTCEDRNDNILRYDIRAEPTEVSLFDLFR